MLFIKGGGRVAVGAVRRRPYSARAGRTYYLLQPRAFSSRSSYHRSRRRSYKVRYLLGAGGLLPLPPPDRLPVVLGAFAGLPAPPFLPPPPFPPPDFPPPPLPPLDIAINALISWSPSLRLAGIPRAAHVKATCRTMSSIYRTSSSSAPLACSSTIGVILWMKLRTVGGAYSSFEHCLAWSSRRRRPVCPASSFAASIR